MTINVVLSNLISEKNLIIKKLLPIMPRGFSNDLFALNKCRIFNIENLTCNKKKFGYQALSVQSADKLAVAYIFEI